MSTVEAIISAVASAIVWFSARGLDGLIGKWMAYLTIAYEQAASEGSKKAFNDAMARIKDQSPAKAQAWADWRSRAASTPASGQKLP